MKRNISHSDTFGPTPPDRCITRGEQEKKKKKRGGVLFYVVSQPFVVLELRNVRFDGVDAVAVLDVGVWDHSVPTPGSRPRTKKESSR